MARTKGHFHELAVKPPLYYIPSSHSLLILCLWCSTMGFSLLSDSDDDKAVDELLSQAMDQSVLEQVAAINCSGFTDSDLPAHLETRFRKLKSLPNAPKPQFLVEKSSQEDAPPSDSNKVPVFEEPPNLEKGLNGDSEDEIFSVSRKIPAGKSKFPSGSSSFLSDDSSSESLSPPRRSGCLWCSPKKSSRKKNKENRVPGNDEFLGDLSIFSGKAQRKLMRKAMEEEEKINREAEKIVKWAKQASLRLEASGIKDDELSDADSFK